MYERHVIASLPGYYVFGDNAMYYGRKGQACIRGLPNAVGIVTKFEPTVKSQAFFRDGDPQCRHYITTGLDNVRRLLNTGHDVWYPIHGVGTGLAELPTRAPRLYEHLTDTVAAMMSIYK